MGQQVFLGYPPDEIKNFITSYYEDKKTTVLLDCTGLDEKTGEWRSDTFLSSFYNIKNYNCNSIAS